MIGCADTSFGSKLQQTTALDIGLMV